MSHYDDVRNRIHRQMVPLPILYRDDYSIDHAGPGEICRLALGEQYPKFLSDLHLQPARFCYG